jgi:hypothetical protein
MARMKAASITFVVAIVVAILALNAAGQNRPTVSDAYATGRYQIVTARIWDPRVNAERPTFVKIDTSTGSSWYFSGPSFPRPDLNVAVEGWVEIQALSESVKDFNNASRLNPPK